MTNHKTDIPAQPTAALVNLDATAAQTLTDCFSEFGIRPLVVAEAAEERVRQEKFQACVLHLNRQAEPILEVLRGSPANRRTTIYGIADPSCNPLGFSQYGINILLQHPVEREATRSVIRSTHRLVSREVRRHPRIPIVLHVWMDYAERPLAAVSRNVSAGGMCLCTEAGLHRNQALALVFNLPGGPQLTVRGTVRWTRPQEQMLGIDFIDGEPARAKIKEWVDHHLAVR